MGAPKKTPEEPNTSQAQAGRPLLTLKKLIDGYSAEATLPARRTKSRGDLRKHPQVKKRRRLNRSKNSLKNKVVRTKEGVDVLDRSLNLVMSICALDSDEAGAGWDDSEAPYYTGIDYVEVYYYDAT